MDAIGTLTAKIGHDAAIEIWQRLNNAFCEIPLSRKGFSAIAMVLDAIYSNAAHGPVHESDFTYIVGTGSESFFDLVYRPPPRMISKNLAEQICLSPISDHATPTFHYGLFLCAVQVRMLGGYVSFQSIINSGAPNTPFVLVFRLPT